MQKAEFRMKNSFTRGGAESLAFSRPKPKELSAFPKSYPLRNRALGGEMVQTLKKNGRVISRKRREVRAVEK